MGVKVWMEARERKNQDKVFILKTVLSGKVEAGIDIEEAKIETDKKVQLVGRFGGRDEWERLKIVTARLGDFKEKKGGTV